MAISLQGTPSVYEAASATTAVVPYPSGIVAGEVLLAHVTFSGGTPPTAVPSGWTQVITLDAGVSVQTGVYYKVATGAESGSVTFTSTAAAGRTTGIIIRWSGVDNTTPIDVSPGTASSTSTQSLVAPSITTVSAGVEMVVHASYNAATSGDFTTPATYTKVSGSTGTGRRTGIYRKTFATAGATGTETWAHTAGSNLETSVIEVPLRPSGSGSGASTPVLNRSVNDIPGTTTMAVKTNTLYATSCRLKCGTDSSLTTGVVFGSAVVPDANGDCDLTVTGLTADTPYYYRVEMTDGASATLLDDWTVGQFKTDATGALDFSFAFSSCNAGTDSNAMGAIATLKPDLFLHLGDEFYADGSGTAVSNFRTKMNEKKTVANHKAVYRTVGSSMTPSDHDGMNNNVNAGSDATAWTNYNQVWREMNPTTDLPGSTGLYRSFKRGRVRFIRLDTRSFATIPSATDDSTKTRLGATQKQWFKDQITNSTEPLIIVQNADPWVGAAEVGDDGWFGFTTERTELANFIVASGKKVIMLGGDMHAVAADSGTNSPGGIPVFQGSPLNNTSSIKGGPWSTGTYPAAAGSAVQQYGLVTITDTPTQITAVFSGRSSDNTERITSTVTVSLADTVIAMPTATITVKPKTSVNLATNPSVATDATGWTAGRTRVFENGRWWIEAVSDAFTGVEAPVEAGKYYAVSLRVRGAAVGGNAVYPWALVGATQITAYEGNTVPTDGEWTATVHASVVSPTTGVGTFGVYTFPGQTYKITDVFVEEVEGPSSQVNSYGMTSAIATADTNLAMPTAAVTVTGYAPEFTTSIPVQVDLPSSAVTVQSLAPEVSTGHSIAMPASAVTLQAFAPSVELYIAIPATQVLVQAHVPGVSAGSQADMPMVGVSVFAYAPEPDVASAVELAMPNMNIMADMLAPSVITGTTLQLPLLAIALQGLAPVIETGRFRDLTFNVTAEPIRASLTPMGRAKRLTVHATAGEKELVGAKLREIDNQTLVGVDFQISLGTRHVPGAWQSPTLNQRGNTDAEREIKLLVSSTTATPGYWYVWIRVLDELENPYLRVPGVFRVL